MQYGIIYLKFCYKSREGVNGMYLCPVCGKEIENTVCSSCGFDKSCDFEHYPTLSKVSIQALGISNLKKTYENKQKKYISCKNCGGKSFYIDQETHECICTQCSKPLEIKHQDTDLFKKQRENNKCIINEQKLNNENKIHRFLNEQEFSEFRIKNLHERFQSEHKPNIINTLKNATELLDLCKNQNGEEKQKTVEKIKALFEKNSLNSNLAVIYAKSLESLSQFQSTKEKSLMEIENLYERFQYNSEIVSIYAGCLFSLLVTQDYEEKKITINELKLLYTDYNNMKINAIAIAYAKGLKNLMIEQSINEREKTLINIKDVYEDFNECEEVAVIYAEALRIICRYKGKSNINVSVKRFRDKENLDAKNILENLRSKFPQNRSIRQCAEEINEMPRY